MDTLKLKSAVRHFEFCSRPRSGSARDAATVEDIECLREQIIKLANAFIEELEE